MISNDAQLMSVADAKEHLQHRRLAFIRPDADSKKFDGAVYNSQSFDVAKAAMADSTDSVVVSAPVNIDADGNSSLWTTKLLTVRNIGAGAVHRPREPFKIERSSFAAEQLADGRLPPSTCLDLAFSRDRIGII